MATHIHSVYVVQSDPLIKQGSSAAASVMPSLDSVDRDKLNLPSLSENSATAQSHPTSVASSSARSELRLPDESPDGKGQYRAG